MRQPRGQQWQKPLIPLGRGMKRGGSVAGSQNRDHPAEDHRGVFWLELELELDLELELELEPEKRLSYCQRCTTGRER